MKQLKFLFLFAAFAVHVQLVAQDNVKGKPVALKGMRGGSMPAETMISTPHGKRPIKDLQIGDNIWSTDYYGKKIEVKIQKKSEIDNTNGLLKIIEVILEDGRKIRVTPKHPDQKYKTILFYKAGDKLDGSIVKEIKEVDPPEVLMDILPEGLMATYWANDVLIGSTLLDAVLTEIKAGGYSHTRGFFPSGDNNLISNYKDKFGCIQDPDIQPSVPGKTKKEVINLIEKKIKYPDSLRINSRVRSVKVLFVIDENGKIFSTSMEKSLHPLVDEACMKALRGLPTFTPAKKNGKAVKVVNRLYVEFDMYGDVKVVSYGPLSFSKEDIPQPDKPTIKHIGPK